MSLRTWFHGPRRLLLVFLVIVLLPSTLLVASGWRLMQQEERLTIQDQQTKRDQMADLVVANLQQQFIAIETLLRGTPGQLASADVADDAVLVVVEGTAVTTVPGRRLLYYPVSTPGREAPFGAFGEGERLELQNNYADAATWYGRTATSVDPGTRAGASIREARNLSRLGQVNAALSALARASGTHNASVNGVPADLFARYTECVLLAAAGRHDELRRRAEALHADLLGGRWRLSRAAFDANVMDAANWLPVTAATESSASARALSAGFEWVWQQAQEGGATAVITSGRELVNAEGRQLTVVWHGDATRLAAFIAGPDFVQAQWLSPLRTAAARQQLGVVVREPGTPAGPTPETRRNKDDNTMLPWTVAVTSAAASSAAATGDRFRIWLAGVSVLALIVIAGTTVIARAAARELAVARLQSDFVAAVSHEFRTPLTYLRQIGEVLQDGRVTSDERRRAYFDALVRQTDRLAHLVETLLDFGRMEAGTSPYRKEPLNLSSWVRSVIEQFNLESAGRGYAVELSASDEAILVQGDPQALTNALWNLLDNAVKYSPECRTVWVTIDRRGDEVTVHVRDRGLGVPAAEHRDIFQKFVRGADAKRRNIAGTGIGLAMVQHIMQAHGGSVRVESEPGHGSTFTLVLPCHAS